MCQCGGFDEDRGGVGGIGVCVWGGGGGGWVGVWVCGGGWVCVCVCGGVCVCVCVCAGDKAPLSTAC